MFLYDLFCAFTMSACRTLLYDLPLPVGEDFALWEREEFFIYILFWKQGLSM